MKRLNGWDAMLLYSETPNIHTHTLKIGVIDVSDFDGNFTFEVFRRTLRRRLHLLEPLRYRLVGIPLKLHHPMWLQNCDIDLGYHLRRVRVPRPGGRRELDEVIGEIARTPLDRSRPMWEMYFAEGMADDRFAVIGKVHHALADGIASANLMAKAMDLKGPIQDERDLYATCAPPPAAQLLREAGRDHLQQLAQLPRLVRETATGVSRVRKRSKERGHHPELAKNFAPPPTFLNHVVSPGRRFATATLSLADVKQTAKRLGITINDLVLATAAGALRELLLRYDGRADSPLIASVPASLNTSPDRLTGNEFFGLNVSLPVQIDDPIERVRMTSFATSIAKEDFHLMGPEVVSQWAAYLPPSLATAAFRWLASREAQSKLMNLPISNVPGPRERGHIGGATVSEIYSVGPLMLGSGINITVWSYVDQLNISVLTDDLTLDDPHEASDAMIHAFTEIRCAAGLSGDLTEVQTAMPRATAV
ncbi:MAG: wax ester/triacylglycerol synthase family O-acyltransferase [Mycobacteriaceae bacterium]|nr:wax ester/triacylglycerol synthase family O-acyltransferase [Mycobacteriaceae bacterium]MBV9638904.1 wax ester/triacylglycerol synthase family O-acyltransferase [Mycobacteriaceae bacterium]